MHWSFSLILTERAWDTLGIPTERQSELQELIGEYEPRWRSFLFKGRETPNWVSRPITVSYQRWGESLERWEVWNSWVAEGLEPPAHHEKRVLEFLPVVREPEVVVFWGERRGPHFCYQDGRLVFLNWDENVSVMPDGKLYWEKDGARVLFEIPAPSLSMSRAEWMRTNDGNRLDRFAAPDNPGVDGFDPAYYRRGAGQERFECEEWDKGFRWELEVHDLRPCLPARITRVQRTLWRRRVTALRIQLQDGGLMLSANPLVVEPAADGRTLPKKGEPVWVVLGDDGEIDRIWLMSV
jgi:hypothetical protein